MNAFVVSLMTGALLLPTTAASLSGQVRVEVDGWWRSGGPRGDRAYEPYREDVRRSGVDGRIVYEDGYRSRGGRVSVHTGRRGPRYRGRPHLDRRPAVRWVAADWRRVRLRGPRHARGRGHRFRNAPYVADLYGLVDRRTYRRLERHAERIGAYGALNARWVRLDRGARILQVRAGRVPLAELVDYDRDPRVEEVWLNRPWYR